MYRTKLYQVSVSINTLLKYYDSEKVENYCKHCNNYNRIWSCPPHDFSTLDYLKTFKSVDLYALKISYEAGMTKDDIMSIFQKERRKFSDDLMLKEGTAFIAGNCYQCAVCSRTFDEPCIRAEKRRYSLESVGLIVGDITKNIMNIELNWSKPGDAGYLVTVGALAK